MCNFLYFVFFNVFTLSTNIGSIIKTSFNDLPNLVNRQLFTHDRLLVEIFLDRLLERFSIY